MTEYELLTPTDFLNAVGFVADDEPNLLDLFLGGAAVEDVAQPKARKSTVKVEKPCPKCGGRGQIDAYYKINNGICFKCGGTGKLRTISQTAPGIGAIIQL